MSNAKQKTFKRTVKRASHDRRSPSTRRSRRNSGESILRTAGLDDAPIEAWQQAMLPHLQRIASTNGFEGAREHAFVFFCLLRLKPFVKIGEFKDWVHHVTGYPRYVINGFVSRATKGFLIVGDQPNAEVLRETEADDESGPVAMMLMLQVLEGELRRNVDGEYSLAEQTK